MNFFNEKYLHPIDQKGRLRLRKDILDHFKIKKGESLTLIPNVTELPYLIMLTSSHIKDYFESLMKQDPGARKMDSLRYARITQDSVTVDGQGRIVIPQRIRDACHLDGTVAVINMDLFIEVWNKKHVERKYPDMVRAFRDLGEILF